MRKLKFAVLLVLGLLVVKPVYAETLAQMRLAARYAIRDTTATSKTTQYSDSFLNYRLNQSADKIARMTYPIYTSILYNAATDQFKFTMSTDTAKVDRVAFMISSSTNSYKALEFSTVKQLDTQKGTTWEQLPSSLPTNYYLKGNVINLVPPVSSSYDRDNALKVYYYKRPHAMMTDGQEPWDGLYFLQDYCYLIILDTVIQCKKERGRPWQDDYSAYQIGLQNMLKDVNAIRPDSQVITVIK